MTTARKGTKTWVQQFKGKKTEMIYSTFLTADPKFRELENQRIFRIERLV